MTKAEQRALEKYPEKIVSGPIGYEEDAFDINAFARSIFEEGYEQAEKDLALTVEDIKTILDISFWNDDPEKILQEYNRLKK